MAHTPSLCAVENLQSISLLTQATLNAVSSLLHVIVVLLDRECFVEYLDASMSWGGLPTAVITTPISADLLNAYFVWKAKGSCEFAPSEGDCDAELESVLGALWQPAKPKGRSRKGAVRRDSDLSSTSSFASANSFGVLSEDEEMETVELETTVPVAPVAKPEHKKAPRKSSLVNPRAGLTEVPQDEQAIREECEQDWEVSIGTVGTLPSLPPLPSSFPSPSSLSSSCSPFSLSSSCLPFSLSSVTT